MSKSLHTYVYTSYLVQGINVVVNFVYSLLIVRLLGAEGFGDFSIFSNSIALLVLVFGFNIPSVMVFFIANQRIHAGRLLFSALAWSLVTAILLYFLLLKSDSIGVAIHIFPGGMNKPVWVLLFVLQFLFLQVNQVLTAFLNANKIFIQAAIFVLLFNILLLVFWALYSLGMIVTDVRLFDFVWWVNIFFQVGMMLSFIYLIFRHTREHLSLRFIGRRELKMLAGFALIVYGCNTLQFLNYKMDIWFIHYYTGNDEAGIYALALSLSQLIWILPNAVSGVLLNYYQVKKREESIRLAMHYGSISIYGSLLTALLLLLVYYFALPLLYGEAFSRVFGLCAILFIGTIPFSLTIVIANLNSGIGFVRLNLYGTLFIFLLGFGLDLWLIPIYGVMGAAVAKVILYLVGLGFQMVVAKFLYKLPWAPLFKWPDFRNLFNKEIVNH